MIKMNKVNKSFHKDERNFFLNAKIIVMIDIFAKTGFKYGKNNSHV